MPPTFYLAFYLFIWLWIHRWDLFAVSRLSFSCFLKRAALLTTKVFHISHSTSISYSFSLQADPWVTTENQWKWKNCLVAGLIKLTVSESDLQFKSNLFIQLIEKQLMLPKLLYTEQIVKKTIPNPKDQKIRYDVLFSLTWF